MTSEPAPAAGQQQHDIGPKLDGIAHDLNNLLAAIEGYGALLLEILPEASDERSFAARIVTAAEGAKALTAELSVLGRSHNLQRNSTDLATAEEPSACERVCVDPHLGKEKPLPGKPRILVVDDEAVIAELVGRMLVRVGYDADWCCNPLDALATFEESPEGWDVVISDQSMPDMTGHELAARLKAVNPALPVILCTGHEAEPLQQLSPRVSAVLVKPVSREQLQQAVEKALNDRAVSLGRSPG